MNLRSRTGCLACKSMYIHPTGPVEFKGRASQLTKKVDRKRRCGEERPACRNCVARGVVCPYLSEPSRPLSLRFKICRGDVRWSSRRRRRDWHFLSISPRDIGLLSAEHTSSTTPGKDETRVEDVSLTALGPSCFGILNDYSSLESQLFQYYLQVISKVRVFQDDPSNHFRSLVVPLCIGQGPLRYAVLSLSANDRRGETSVDYGQLALSYKSQSLRLLRESLAGMDRANEALMTCLILCSLEIACGSRTDWVRHARGAFAIINNFADMVDPQILFFVYSYFQSRTIFFLTTSASGQLDEATTATNTTHANTSELHDASNLKLDFDQLCTNRMRIQPHMGCSLGLLELIAQTTRLVQRKRQQRQSGRNSLTNEEDIRSRAMSIRSQLESLVEENPSGNDYLATCAECFRVAADLFLQLACDVPLHQVFLQEKLCYLLGRIGRVVYEGQERQLFPMWPLFLAGCLSSSDEDRLRVLDYFAVLSQQWPISNIPVVREATETIWKSRDLNPDSKSRDGFDWQVIIEQMNWKLALS